MHLSYHTIDVSWCQVFFLYTFYLSSASTAAVADAAAAVVASAVTAAVSAAMTASAATVCLDSSGHNIFVQVLISGIIDLRLFAIDILIRSSGILSLRLPQIHQRINQCRNKSYHDPGKY